MDSMSNKELLSQHGIKNTRQRLLTLDVLKSAKEPQSAEQIYLKIKDRDSTLSLSTVYRILDILVDKNLLTRTVHSQGGRATFELNNMQHKHHLTCIRCQRTVVILGCPLESYVDTLEKKTNFSITSHRLEIYGVCAGCK